ncbi:DUF2399 domain-containing protein [Streptomyces coelicoflavus]|uniref:DUF2399 domain-containing protein n=1 Tax=Streptomyces coelicoflavus TaxID=285562 RepID=UPI00350E5797
MRETRPVDAPALNADTLAFLTRPGIALANRITQRYDAEPWRMRAADYEYLAIRAQVRDTPTIPLTGPPAEAAWDPELAPTMTAVGIALHEEAVLDLLLEDLG